VARIRETQKISVFSVRGSFTHCDTDAAGEPVELRGVDLDGDEIDEVAVLYTSANTNQRSLQVFRVSAPMAPCAFQPVLADVLEGCVDVANVGGRLVAICRAAAAGPANTVISIANDGGNFRREGVIAGLQGDGRFATAGDFDGDGVLDVAISVNRIAEIGVSFLRQCPAHDTRGCRRPE
jgi:hypothetical protein